jgi:hypothetical protein
MRVMRCRLILAFVTALATQDPTAGPVGNLTLELRVFNGAEEVTAQSRVTVQRAGERAEPLRHTTSADGRVKLQVPAGIYDVQAIHEREGRVLNIRWANRLVVMPYSDEQGHHLEVVNFKNGFGALQIRGRSSEPPDVALYEAGKREKAVATPVSGPTYVLFVVPAGVYDLRTRSAGKPSWQTGVEVPLDRTRFLVIE